MHIPGAAIFMLAAWREFLFAFDVLLLGTAMSLTPPVVLFYLLRAWPVQIVNY
jgi:hypothetical protein